MALLDAGGNIGSVSKLLKYELEEHGQVVQHRIVEPLRENIDILRKNNPGRSIEIIEAALVGNDDRRKQVEILLPTTNYQKYRACEKRYSLHPGKKEAVVVPSLRWCNFFKDLKESVEGVYLKADCEGPEEHVPAALQMFLPQAPSHCRLLIVIGELSYDNHPMKGYDYWNRWLRPLDAIRGWALLERSTLRGNPGLSKNTIERRSRYFHVRFEWVFTRMHS